MTQEELIKFLSENLTVEVSHPVHDVGFFDSIMESDEHNITVKIKLCGKLVCEEYFLWLR